MESREVSVADLRTRGGPSGLALSVRFGTAGAQSVFRVAEAHAEDVADVGASQLEGLEAALAADGVVSVAVHAWAHEARMGLRLTVRGDEDVSVAIERRVRSTTCRVSRAHLLDAVRAARRCAAIGADAPAKDDRRERRRREVDE